MTTRVGGTRVTARGKVAAEQQHPGSQRWSAGLLQVDAVEVDGTPVGTWTLPAQTWLVLVGPLIQRARQRSTA